MLKIQNRRIKDDIDEMELHKYCCRQTMLSNVHIISYLS